MSVRLRGSPAHDHGEVLRGGHFSAAETPRRRPQGSNVILRLGAGRYDKGLSLDQKGNVT